MNFWFSKKLLVAINFCRSDSKLKPIVAKQTSSNTLQKKNLRRNYSIRFKLMQVLINTKLKSYFLKCVFINKNQGPSDFLMVWNYCGFHLTQFWRQISIQKRLEIRVSFLLGRCRKIKSFNININRGTWATEAILSYKANII